MLVGKPGMLDVVVVFVAPLDALLSAEVLIRASALLCVAHLVVEGRSGTIPTPVGRPADRRQKQNDGLEASHRASVFLLTNCAHASG